MAKAVKLADIAERVGVSTVTVSKALSGQKGVSEDVREKIRSIAEELGYQQPSAADVPGGSYQSHGKGMLYHAGGHRNVRGRERQNAEAGTGTQGGWHYRYR